MQLSKNTIRRHVVEQLGRCWHQHVPLRWRPLVDADVYTMGLERGAQGKWVSQRGHNWCLLEARAGQSDN